MITIMANGKINLTLDVLGKRDDGYHEVEMVMQSINLSDKLTIEKIDICDIILDCVVKGVLNKKDNLIYKAADLFLRTYNIDCGVKISLEKNIPVAAGLAGGSTDAAAVLCGMNDLFGCGLSVETLCTLAAKLGSDVPFCVRGGTMLAKGRGEKLAPVASLPAGCAFVLIKPQLGVSTAWVYKNYQAQRVKKHPNNRLMLRELEDKNLNGVCGSLGNVLESVTIGAYPQLAAYKEKLCRYGAKAALMSGSGPSIFAVCENIQVARKVADRMRNDYAELEVYEAVPASARK
ncbi:4-(cytidine 5'-diphospho)-2-C-methyl-D-erythritol kinase [Pectinatus cerevisiiphilus]|uniref:4-diphosphocytidyl-2-C-methyl-D-erythritol kinase n=1 Tax=Pectinatus cerevisiiphilus TaxID=86956 RepID=A0A4V2URT1_9FIRM|nr:4-(cytidine 5'-diphospho)-2-C-methyl-D-erythritol kinase [Pectinatus cerevisiiphilus]TCS78672.1 4-diphosphocytidyl-2-C-methyl-D-erythritol kinase [Pectinatus cerevisiiphilus]